MQLAAAAHCLAAAGSIAAPAAHGHSLGPCRTQQCLRLLCRVRPAWLAASLAVSRLCCGPGDLGQELNALLPLYGALHCHVLPFKKGHVDAFTTPKKEPDQQRLISQVKLHRRCQCLRHTKLTAPPGEDQLHPAVGQVAAPSSCAAASPLWDPIWQATPAAWTLLPLYCMPSTKCTQRLCLPGRPLAGNASNLASFAQLPDMFKRVHSTCAHLGSPLAGGACSLAPLLPPPGTAGPACCWARASLPRPEPCAGPSMGPTVTSTQIRMTLSSPTVIRAGWEVAAATGEPATSSSSSSKSGLTPAIALDVLPSGGAQVAPVVRHAAGLPSEALRTYTCGQA